MEDERKRQKLTNFNTAEVGDLLLIHPPTSRRIRDNEIDPTVKDYFNTLDKESILQGDQPTEPPIGLLYIASNARKNGHRVGLLDINLIDLKFREKNGIPVTNEMIEEILQKKQFKVFAITCITSNYIYAKIIAGIIKKYLPDALVVLGGLYPTSSDQKILLDCADFDIIIRGEGEVTMVEILNAVKRDASFENIRGITTRKNRNPDRELINLDDLPIPAYDLVPEEYKLIPRVITARGCSANCGFCSPCYFYRGEVRFRSPIKVIEELEYLKTFYGCDSFLFGDLTFWLNSEHSSEICNEMISRQIDMNFWCQTRVDRIDSQMAKLLKKAGCTQVAVGIEGGSQSQLNNAGKGILVSNCEKACQTLKIEGINVQTYWVLGLPNETVDSGIATIKTLEYYIKNNLTDVTHISMMTPFPGTELYNNPNKFEIEIISSDMEKYWLGSDLLGYAPPVHKTKELSEFQIDSLYKLALSTATSAFKNQKNKQHVISDLKQEVNFLKQFSNQSHRNIAEEVTA